MKPRVYIETTVVSYLTARPTRDLISLARQKITLDWWRSSASSFTLCSSDLVLDECDRGDREAVAKRWAVLEEIPRLALTFEVDRLAKALLRGRAVPPTAAEDAAHIAVAAVHAVPFILTWNFRHIANAVMMEKLRSVCADAGYTLPTICTPEQLSRGRL